MRSRTTLPVIVMMALGGLLGYAAASGRAKMAQAQVGESTPTARAHRPTVVSEKQGSCCENVGLAQMLTSATNNERVQAAAQAPGKKPNIVIIWGDDIGQSDISAYSMGLMGFRTPNMIGLPGKA
jgi:arylsulfatase